MSCDSSCIFRERLDELLLRRGFSTGRRIRRFLQTHELCINGKRALLSGTPVSLRYDTITLDGKNMNLVPDVYLVMNKASGCLCTNSNSGNEYKTVYDYVPEQYLKMQGSLHTVGRLDGNTEGLLILTTNGDFSHSLVMPQTHVPKKYLITLEEPVNPEQRQLWVDKCRSGMHLPAVYSGPAFDTKPAELEWVDSSGLQCTLVLTEGKFHQVKRMVAELGNKVHHLVRISMGKLELPPDLALGECRELTDAELILLQNR